MRQRHNGSFPRGGDKVKTWRKKKAEKKTIPWNKKRNAITATYRSNTSLTREGRTTELKRSNGRSARKGRLQGPGVGNLTGLERTGRART